MAFRNKLKELAQSSGLFAIDDEKPATPSAASSADEDPLAAMERLVAESRARVPQQQPPISFEPVRQAPPPPRPAQPGTPPGTPPREGPLEIPGPPAMLAVEEIYRQAKLQTSPETGTVLKIIVLTADPNLAALPRQTKAAMVRASLAADRVTPEHVVDDAIARDRALDGAFDFLQKHVADFKDRAATKVADLEAERERMLQEFNSRIAALRQASNDAEDNLAAWLRQKRDIERGLFEAVAMVIPSGVANPITLDEGSGPVGTGQGGGSAQ